MTSPTAPAPDFTRGAAFVAGSFVPIAEARIPILDYGFLHSDATYDVAHVWKGRFFRLEEHLDRFERGMAKLRMSVPYTRQQIRETLFECVRLSGLRDAYVEMICTRGLPAPGSRDPRQCQNAFMAFAIPFVWIADPAKQEAGLNLHISEVQRIQPESVDPTVKNYHWLDLVTGLFDAYDHRAETAVLVDRAGNVAEGPGFNVFAVKDGTIVTPDRGVLAGVTRRTAIELAGEAGYRVEVRPVQAGELRGADEVFITSTAGGIMPVTQVSGSPLGDGRPGAITRRLRDLYWSAHEEPRWTEPVFS